jgi:hypothetical protein
MKKKLKVKKAFAGKMMRAAPAQERRVIKPVRGQLLPSKPRDPNMFSSTPPRPGMIQPLPSPGMQQPAPVGLGEYALRQQPAPGGLGGQINPGMSPGASSALNDLMKRYGQQPGMAQPLPAAPGPLGGPAPQGGDRFVNLKQQAAPVQPVPAMKKGGVVRGGRKETKGLRKAKLY